VINQVLTQQAVIALPVATAGPYSVPSPLPPPSGSGTGVASIAGPPAVSVMVDLAPSDQSLLRLLATSADISARDVFIRLRLQNGTSSVATLVALPTLGSMPQPISSPLTIAAGATGLIVVPILNVPATSHPIQILVFDI